MRTMPPQNPLLSIQSLSIFLPVPAQLLLDLTEVCSTFCSVYSLLTTVPAGKSTLLQILAGKRLVNGADILIKDRDVFRDSPPGVTFLGTEWAMNPVVRGDIVVSHFLDSVGGYRHKERRDMLLDILDVDLDW